MKTVEFELGDTLYELRIRSFDLGERPTRDSPGEGPSVDFDAVVNVVDDDSRKTVTFQEFLSEYTSYMGGTERDLEDAAIEQLMESLDDDAHDAEMSASEDY